MALLWLSGCSQAPHSPSDADFVQVEGNGFVLRGEPYHFVGTNLWYGAYLGSPGPQGDRERLVRELDTLKANGITNLRVLAASEASELTRAVRPAMIEAPGEYNDNLLRGLDFLLAEMARRDMKAVLYLNNFWQWSGGMAQYVAWFTGEPVLDPDATGEWNAFMQNSARFYRLPEAQAFYRQVIELVVTRTNSINGRRYNDDPTIMSWQLANEPRPGSDADGRPYFDHFKRWIHESARHIDSLAPRQLVSTGNEGAMGSLRDIELYREAHQSPHVDYLTFHLWPKNWGWFDIDRPEQTYDPAMANAKKYIDRHIDLADEMGKPTVLSEFGVERDRGRFEPGTPTRYRDRIYRAIFDQVYRRARASDAIAGTNFWTWGGAGRAGQSDHFWQEGDDFTGDPPQEAQGLNSVFDSDESTLKVIREHAARMRALNE